MKMTEKEERLVDKMDGLSSNSFLMMQRSMEFLWSKQSCILDNIANVETPGYQVKYATFEEALKNASSPPPKWNLLFFHPEGH